MDVVPRLDEEAERIRAGQGIYPRNYLAGIHDYTLRDCINVIRRSGRRRFKRRFRAHMPAIEIRPLVGEGIWNRYYKFTIDRNPWERQVSHYFFNTRNKSPRPEFGEWMRNDRRARLGNFENYAIGGKVAVEHVARYENIDQELKKILAHLGIREKLVLPRAKTSFRKKNRPYRDYYDEETREMVRSWYADEIETLGYEF